jgi:4-amino-4-deoxy-L-arabinose transferase-like glycosyltransferase
MKWLSKNSILIILMILVLVGLFLRVYRLSEVPLYGDELTIVLDANSLLHTGKDQTGESFPLTFSMGAGRPAGYVYASIPFVVLFGVNEWGVRGLSILSGLLGIILMYFLGRKLVDERVGILAATLFTFSFWDINLSRGGYEAHFALILALGGVVSALYSAQKKWLLIISAICFGLTFHTYPTYKVVLPLFLIGFGIYIFHNKNKLLVVRNRVFLVSIALFFILSFISVLQTFTGGSENRFLNINVFSDPQIQEHLTQKINQERTASQLSDPLRVVFHNRVLENLKLIGQNYLHNLSFDFLFLYGDKNPRHNMATQGFFYLIEILTMFVGFVFLIHKKLGKLLFFLLSWILVAPIATSLISDPHGLRSAFLLPPLLIISAMGISYLLDLIKVKQRLLVTGVLLVFFAAQFIYFAEKMYFLSPQLYESFWAGEGKYAAEVAMQNKDKYSQIVLSDKIDSIEYAYPVYAKVSPYDVITQHPKTEVFLETAGFKKFENIYIGNVQVEQLGNQPSVLYIGKIEDKDKMGDYVTVKDRSGKDILVVGQVKP